MKQRGRKSGAEMATVTAMPLRLVKPPDDLTEEEAAVWAKVTATKPAEWWDAGSVPLLTEYCRADVQSDLVADLVRSTGKAMLADPGELDRYKELRKIQAGLAAQKVSLARSMRLTQQSRYRADKADTTSRKAAAPAKPWHHARAV
ncbi:hypothetical protein [Luteimonas sp. A478]